MGVARDTGEILTSFPVTREWTAEDLLFHLADYDQVHESLISLALSRTMSDESIDYSKIHYDSLRARVQEFPIDAAIEALMESRFGFRTAIERASAEDLDCLYPFNTNTGKSQGSVRTWILSCIRHDVRHIRDIRKWRNSSAQQKKTGSKGILLAMMQIAREDLLDSIA